MDNILNSPIPVTITSPTLKKGKNDVRTFDAILNVVEGTRTYVLTETKRNVDRKRFDLIPGSIITDSSGSYVCKEVRFQPAFKRILPVIFAS